VDDLGSFAVFAAIYGAPADVDAKLAMFLKSNAAVLELKVQDIRLNNTNYARTQMHDILFRFLLESMKDAATPKRRRWMAHRPWRFGDRP
jgi:hypothetical protein